jgi:hypothetical protein
LLQQQQQQQQQLFVNKEIQEKDVVSRNLQEKLIHLRNANFCSLIFNKSHHQLFQIDRFYAFARGNSGDNPIKRKFRL